MLKHAVSVLGYIYECVKADLTLDWLLVDAYSHLRSRRA
jgi:hypothetical protein